MRISVIGSVGVPSNYGGFETLVHNLVDYHHKTHSHHELFVYCSRPNYTSFPKNFLDANLEYLPIKANGVWSIPYDIWSIYKAISNGSDFLLILGTSGAIVFPLLRLLNFKKKIITNIDGLEWRRNKWNNFVRFYLKFCEFLAVKYSHVVIADNEVVASYVNEKYREPPTVIAYGGDHVLESQSKCPPDISIPDHYAFCVCRIEPENNVDMILEAFSRVPDRSLIVVGNWQSSSYGRNLREKYSSLDNLVFVDSIYDLGILKYLRSNALIYMHGHSARGTNPSLVEAMHFAKPILAFDCDFNRATTEDSCIYFQDLKSLEKKLRELDLEKIKYIGTKMKEVADRRYTWNLIANQYFELFDSRSG